MDFEDILLGILEEIASLMPQNLNESIDVAVSEILMAERLFLFGMGRTGLIMKAFAMRLMHLGMKVHFVGDVTTPSIRVGDLFLVGTASGETPSIIHSCNRSRKAGSRILSLTGTEESTVTSLSDRVVHIGIKGKKSREKVNSLQPMGNGFQQALLILTDMIIIDLKEKMGISTREMFYNHTNLE